MKAFYDLHIHSALSPCADADMTPNNIVNMSLIKGLNVIALTDHNACDNCAATMQAAENAGILCIPGMELETAESIHVVCLFDTLSGAEAFSGYIAKRLPAVKNRTDIYLPQNIFDAEDNVTGTRENLLALSSSVTVNDAVALTAEYGGICYPAHIDREANGIISILGMIHSELNFQAIELSSACLPGFFLGRKYLENYNRIKSSDAHSLGAISEPVNSFELDELSIPAIFDAILSKKRRR